MRLFLYLKHCGRKIGFLIFAISPKSLVWGLFYLISFKLCILTYPVLLGPRNLSLFSTSGNFNSVDLSLHEKYPNKEFFLVRIQENTVVSPA